AARHGHGPLTDLSTDVRRAWSVSARSSRARFPGPHATRIATSFEASTVERDFLQLQYTLSFRADEESPKPDATRRPARRAPPISGAAQSQLVIRLQVGACVKRR